MQAQQSHKPAIGTRKVYSRFKNDIWIVDLAELGSLISSNYGAKYLLHLIDVFTKYPCVKALMDKKAKAVE